ncbi:uncharacterized protein BO96DRAFT_339434 [Aspergillus niger CBS 101883]|nr:uncharacterized protein BO96DRAFT_339434 [Aspergillus niger CBS 101883]PYH55763.1 hypothetical protein BO96DRAFT_339434 [Aspergillus niger CBS 101883]RDH14465.1 hypothetical protein M747DRAFT_362827 [Aspergillus niger ATCC 13496]
MAPVGTSLRAGFSPLTGYSSGFGLTCCTILGLREGRPGCIASLSISDIIQKPGSEIVGMGILAGGLGSEGFLRESPHLFVWLGEAIEFWEKVDGLLAHSVVSSWLEGPDVSKAPHRNPEDKTESPAAEPGTRELSPPIIAIPSGVWNVKKDWLETVRTAPVKLQHNREVAPGQSPWGRKFNFFAKPLLSSGLEIRSDGKSEGLNCPWLLGMLLGRQSSQVPKNTYYLLKLGITRKTVDEALDSFVLTVHVIASLKVGVLLVRFEGIRRIEMRESPSVSRIALGPCIRKRMQYRPRCVSPCAATAADAMTATLRTVSMSRPLPSCSGMERPAPPEPPAASAKIRAALVAEPTSDMGLLLSLSHVHDRDSCKGRKQDSSTFIAIREYKKKVMDPTKIEYADREEIYQLPPKDGRESNNHAITA